MLTTSYLFDEAFMDYGFQGKCLSCACLGNGCAGVHASMDNDHTRTTRFYCSDFRKNGGQNSEGVKLLTAKIARRLNHQLDMHARGGRNYRWR